MLDIHLAASLFRAVPDGAQVLLIGDADQLPLGGSGQCATGFDCVGGGTRGPAHASVSAGTAVADHSLRAPDQRQPGARHWFALPYADTLAAARLPICRLG